MGGSEGSRDDGGVGFRLKQGLTRSIDREGYREWCVSKPAPTSARLMPRGAWARRGATSFGVPTFGRATASRDDEDVGL